MSCYPAYRVNWVQNNESQRGRFPAAPIQWALTIKGEAYANKKGVRYRYYTSHALLQRRNEHAGSVPRVSAPELEALVCEALRRENSVGEDISDKDLVVQGVAKVIVRHDRIEVDIRKAADREEPGAASKLVIGFSPSMGAQKGITREPPKNGHIDAAARENLLNGIKRAAAWVEAVKSGQANSFAQIAAGEGLGERHVRRLAVLAFLSPNLLNAVASCTAPAELTASVLTEALPHCWVQQEAMLGRKNSKSDEAPIDCF